MEKTPVNRQRTIIDAVKEVMHAEQRPLTYKEAYEGIIAANLYQFRSTNPLHIVRMEIRRHAEGVDFPTAAQTKHFRLIGQYQYEPLPQPLEIARTRKTKSTKATVRVKNQIAKQKKEESLKSLEDALRRLREKYLRRLERQVLSALKGLDPTSFEQFSGLLMRSYGFEKVTITQASRDGGIDGHGKLRVGLASLNVAFQCKRYGQRKVGRPDVDKFRGASQGSFEQAIFFTTSSFTDDAVKASTKFGAVPVVLVDGRLIFQFMVEKKFGIDIEPFDLPVFALDKAITEASEMTSSGDIR